MRRLFLLLALLSIAAAKEPPALTMKFNPMKSFAPATVRITLHIERDVDNRALAWTCDSGDSQLFSRAWTIDGDQGPITFEDQKTMRSVFPGFYQCIAELQKAAHVDENGKVTAPDRVVRVSGNFEVLGEQQ